MQSIRHYLKCFVFIVTTIILTACSGSCVSAGNNPDTNPPIVTLLPNSGNATVTIPISDISMPEGNVNTSTSISLDGGTPGLVIGLSNTVTAAQNSVVSNSLLLQNTPITVSFNPESLVADSVVNSSIQIRINPNTPAGIYQINIYANYLVNSTMTQVIIGTLTVNYAGPTPTPTPTPTPLAGTLSISPENLSVNINDQSILTVSLDNSSMVSNLVVYLSTESPNIATITPAMCTLSTESNICTISVNGISYGTTTITASATNYVSDNVNATTVNPWSQVGGNVTSSSGFNSIIQDGSGNIYAGGATPSSSAPVLGGVWLYNGTTWSQVGGSSISSATVIGPILRDKSGNIYAAGRSINSYGGLWLYNGTTWSQQGGDVESAYSFASIIQDESGNIYASGQAISLVNAGVWMWNGNTWSQLGGDYVPSATGLTSMVRDESGNIYAAGTAGGFGAVWKWNGISWSQLGANINAVNTFTSIIRDRSGNLYAAGTAQGGIFSGGGGGVVWMWNGSVWSQVGGNVTSKGSFSSIIQDVKGNLYAGGQTNGSATAWKWNGQTWSQLGTNISSATIFQSMLRDVSGNIYAGGIAKSPTSGGLWLYQP